MRLEFDPNASALPFVEKDIVNQNSSFDTERMLREGVRAAQEGRRAEARKTLLQVTETDANNENAWLWLASISEYPEELLVFLNNVLRINSQNERALEWHKATKSLLAKTLVQRGVDAVSDDRRAFARQCFEQALEHEAENEMAWLWMASVADSDEEKTACFEKVLSVNPENADALASLAAIHSQKTQAMLQHALAAAFDGRHAAAHEMIEAVLERDAEMEDAWVLKSHIAASFEERAECFLKLRALNPENELANAALASWKSLAEKRLAQTASQPAAAAETPESNGEISFAGLNETAAGITETAPKEVQAESETAQDESAAAQFEQRDETPSMEFADTEELFPIVNESAQPQQFETSFEAAENETADSAEVLTHEVAAEPAKDEYAEFQPEPVKFDNGDADDILEEFTKLQNDLATELEETEMNWAFNEPAPPTEAEDYFRNFGEAGDIHRTQTADASEGFVSNFEPENLPQELAVEAESAAEMSVEAAPEAQAEEWRDTSPLSFVSAAPEISETPSATNGTEFSYAEARAAFEEIVELEKTGSFEEEPMAAVEVPSEVYAAAPEAAEEPEEPEMFAEYNYLHRFARTEEENPAVEESFEFSAPAEVFEKTSVAEPAQEVSTRFEETIAPAPQEDFPQPKSERLLCPFCNAENEKQAYSCASCRTILTLSDLEMLLTQLSADVERLAPAVSSLESENQSYGLNAEQLANLGIGHINLKNFRQGFHYLQESVRRNPNNVILDAQVNALAIRLAEIEEQQTAHDAMAKNRKILVVDDSPTVRKLISGKLEKCGHEVICAVDGLDALQKINEATPDLILLDITMPRMDGYQVCKMIRGNDATKDVPVVMISGKDGFFDKVRGRMAGTTGYITKPFGPETLMKTVETYL